MGKPISKRITTHKEATENLDGPGRKPIFASGIALARLQVAIPEGHMEKLRLLAAFRNVHLALVLAELIEEGWDKHHLSWMNQDLMHPRSLP